MSERTYPRFTFMSLNGPLAIHPPPLPAGFIPLLLCWTFSPWLPMLVSLPSKIGEVSGVLQRPQSQYGCVPLYPHSTLSALSYAQVKYLCQERKLPVPWILKVYFMWMATKSSYRVFAPGYCEALNFDGALVRHCTAAMYAFFSEAVMSPLNVCMSMIRCLLNSEGY
jgi:hypothetical protein